MFDIFGVLFFFVLLCFYDFNEGHSFEPMAFPGKVFHLKKQIPWYIIAFKCSQLENSKSFPWV